MNSGVLHMEDGRQQLKKQLLASDGAMKMASSRNEEAVLPVEVKRHCDCQWRWKAVEQAVRDDMFRQKSFCL